jgi:hypothetical protein
MLNVAFAIFSNNGDSSVLRLCRLMCGDGYASPENALLKTSRLCRRFTCAS